MPQGPDELRRTAEASRWLAELRDSPDDDTVNRWLRWGEQDPRNLLAYQRVQEMWRQMDQVCPDPQDAADLLHVRPQPRAARVAWIGAAAALVSAAVLWRFVFTDPAPPLQAARVGENRTTVLPDGSTLALGAKTTVAMEFSGEHRILQLSPGQAYFKVKPDRRRPFTVRAGELEVTAIGTAFDVKREPERIVITVQEGMVEIAKFDPAAQARSASAPQAPLEGSGRIRAGTDPKDSWRVGSGYQFVYSAAQGTTTLSAVDTSAVLAWRDGRLEYVRAPLASVIADINRYAQHPVELADPADPRLSALTFTGTVFTDSIDGWLTALPGALPLALDRTASGRVLIKPR